MNTNTNEALGRITTFYSYKGGTGRSMLLANVAMVLASNDRKVAVIDWDLEAPGLHRYFKPFLLDPDLSSTLGLMDMVTGYWDQLVEFNCRKNKQPEGWEQKFLDIHRYGVTLRLPGMGGEGCIVFIPAGRQYSGYATKVSAFDWDAFYADAGGRGFIEALAQRLRGKFDHILIDSRTGVSDTAGICTIQLPDELVVCFTYNNQSMLGATAIATYAEASRRAAIGEAAKQRATADNCADASARLQSPMRLFPVPTRADTQLPELLQPRRDIAQKLMAWALADLSSEAQRQYWIDVEVSYLPTHSYFETLACLTDRPGDQRTMLATTENLARLLTDGTVQRWIPIFSDKERDALRRAMQSASPNIAYLSAATHAGTTEWNEADIDAMWPVLLRLVCDAKDGEGVDYRAVPAGRLNHLSGKVNELIHRGLLVVRTAVGGVNMVELSRLVRASSNLLQERFQAQRALNHLLLEVETAAGQWQASGGRDSLLLKNRKWLRDMRHHLEQLRLLNALSPSENLYIVASQEYQARQESSIQRLGIVGVVLVSVPLILWQYYKYLNESQAANTRLQGLAAALEVGRREADLLRAKVDFATSQADTLRSEIQVLEARMNSSPPPKSCRDKSNGVESYGKIVEETGVSSWLGGGHNQSEWCDRFIGSLRGRYPDGEFDILLKNETSKNTCAPFNCPQYQYFCKVRVRSNPIYAAKPNAVCNSAS